MRVLKRLLPLFLASCLLLASGCGGKAAGEAREAQILDSGSLGKSTTYRLKEIQPEPLGHSASLTVSESWQFVKSIRSGNSELRLKEICVSRGQHVSAGDPIAILEGLGSQADMELMRLEISSAEANQKELLSYYEGALQAAEGMSSSGAERALRVEYAQLELEKYKLQSDYYLSSLYSQLSVLEAEAAQVVLTAPVEGSIRSLNTRLSPGDLVPAGTEVCSVYADAGLRFYGNSSSGSFVYGRSVSIRISKGSRSQTVTGRVVSSPEVVSGVFPTNVVLLELDEPAAELLSTEGEARVSYTLLDGVYTVPSGAVKNRDGVSYVELLEGDTVRSRNVVRGPSAGGNVTILHGLREGDQVVVSSYNS
ncbi:MAG: hypothetical protein IKO91_06820 [Oscillospiraceae bacterium]|nr:hypothetical protein [Oscillospiraceae bacterium]